MDGLKTRPTKKPAVDEQAPHSINSMAALSAIWAKQLQISEALADFFVFSLQICSSWVRIEDDPIRTG
jgi:hypothetical protein